MRRIIFSLWIIILLVGCSESGKVKFVQQTTEEIDRQKVEKILEAFPIQTANILLYEDELLVTVQLQPFAKFGKKKEEKRIEEALTKEFNTQEIFVSTDYKMHIEVAKLMKNPTAKKIDSLKKLAKEQT